MDVDVTVDMCLSDILRKHIIIHEVLSALRTILEHCAHRCITVDVGVLSLDIRILGVRICEFVVDVHQIGLCLSDFGMLSTIENVSLSCLLPVVFDEHLLYDILYLLYCAGVSFELLYDLLCEVRIVDARHLLSVYGLVGCVDGVKDLRLVKAYFLAVSLDDSVHSRSFSDSLFSSSVSFDSFSFPIP